MRSCTVGDFCRELARITGPGPRGGMNRTRLCRNRPVAFVLRT